jgi:hypothetical protein
MSEVRMAWTLLWKRKQRVQNGISSPGSQYLPGKSCLTAESAKNTEKMQFTGSALRSLRLTFLVLLRLFAANGIRFHLGSAAVKNRLTEILRFN